VREQLLKPQRLDRNLGSAQLVKAPPYDRRSLAWVGVRMSCRAEASL